MTEKERQKAAEARNAYAREWRAANKDKVREANLRYWLRRAQKESDSAEEEQKEMYS